MAAVQHPAPSVWYQLHASVTNLLAEPHWALKKSNFACISVMHIMPKMNDNFCEMSLFRTAIRTSFALSFVVILKTMAHNNTYSVQYSYSHDVYRFKKYQRQEFTSNNSNVFKHAFCKWSFWADLSSRTNSTEIKYGTLWKWYWDVYSNQFLALFVSLHLPLI